MEKVKKYLEEGHSIYVSVTGLQLTKWTSLFVFLRHAAPSFRSSQTSEGNLYTSTMRVEGARHTLTVWKSKAYMQKFVYGKVHSKAIQAFRKYFKGKTYGYEARELPNWKSALEALDRNGREY